MDKANTSKVPPQPNLESSGSASHVAGQPIGPGAVQSSSSDSHNTHSASQRPHLIDSHGQGMPGSQLATGEGNPSEAQNPDPKYLHLCINGKNIPILSAIEVGQFTNDQYLFQAISQEYQHVRQQNEWSILFLIPASVRKLFRAAFAPLDKLTKPLGQFESVKQFNRFVQTCSLHIVESGDFVQVRSDSFQV